MFMDTGVMISDVIIHHIYGVTLLCGTPVSTTQVCLLVCQPLLHNGSL